MYCTMIEEFLLRSPFYDLLMVVRSSTSPFSRKLLLLEAGGLDDEDLIILILSIILIMGKYDVIQTLSIPLIIIREK